MTSIGLFGDSFAGKPSIPSYKYHWISLLSNRLNLEHVNYGESGSSMYFSYKEFLSNYKKHDLNIFLVTEPSRYIKQVELYNGNKSFVPCIMSLGALSKDVYNPDEQTLRGWFLASDDQYNKDMSALMLKHICELDSRCIVIQCFGTSATMPDAMPIDLYTIQLHQFEQYKISNPHKKLVTTPTENPEIISGHLVPEYNEFVFNIILNKIKNSYWDCKLPEQMKFQFPIDQLYI